MLALLCAWAAVAEGAEFVINPLRVYLDRDHRTGEFVVRNDGVEALRMQMQALRWVQDAEGKDRYEPDDSLLFFPRSMEIPPGGSRVVRLGIKAAPVAREEAYRLFVEELPPARTATQAAPGASLQVLLRVGVAVFVAPLEPKIAGAIERIELRAGTIAWAVVNTGNAHFRADQVELTGRAQDGTSLFVDRVDDRYFLAGSTRTLAFRVPSDACSRLKTVEARVVAEKVDLKRAIDVDPASCR